MLKHLKKRCESLNPNWEKRYNNRTGLDWIRTQEKIIGLNWTGLKKYLDRTWTQFLESKKLWTGFGFGKVQSTYTPNSLRPKIQFPFPFWMSH